MNFIRKIFLNIKNFFTKHNKVKSLEEHKIETKESTKNSFNESLKVDLTKKMNNKNIETLICKGNGLGIQKNITY